MVAGKTGTTENYGDAWFVGWTKEYTVAVWVGYPDEFKPMKTEFQGDPVAGGTFPAGIWKSFMQSLLKIDPLPKKDGGDGTGKDIDPESTPTPGAGTVPPPTATVPPATPETPQDDGGQTAPPPTEEQPPPTEEQPPPTEEQPPPTEEQPPATTDPGTGGDPAAPPGDDGTG
jgi:penicillin-binding protein 1A